MGSTFSKKIWNKMFPVHPVPSVFDLYDIDEKSGVEENKENTGVVEEVFILDSNEKVRNLDENSGIELL